MAEAPWWSLRMDGVLYAHMGRSGVPAPCIQGDTLCSSAAQPFRTACACPAADDGGNRPSTFRTCSAVDFGFLYDIARGLGRDARFGESTHMFGCYPAFLSQGWANRYHTHENGPNDVHYFALVLGDDTGWRTPICRQVVATGHAVDRSAVIVPTVTRGHTRDL